MPEVGYVKFFDSRETKRFGFLRLVSGEEIFFHFNDGRFIEAGGNSPEFSDKSSWTMYDGTVSPLRAPMRDETIVFLRSRGSKGDKAAPWGYQTQWQAIEKTLARRPIYRALTTMNMVGKDPGEPEVLWQGQDLRVALLRFPLPTGHQSPSADPMLPYFADSDDIFEVHRWWECRQPPDGEWERCDDPRPLNGTLRTFEQISRS